MITKKDGDKYFGNLRIIYEGEITDIVYIKNNMMETDMRTKNK